MRWHYGTEVKPPTGMPDWDALVPGSLAVVAPPTGEQPRTAPTITIPVSPEFKCQALADVWKWTSTGKVSLSLCCLAFRVDENKLFLK